MRLALKAFPALPQGGAVVPQGAGDMLAGYLTQGPHGVNTSLDPSAAANNGTIASARNFSLNSSATGRALLCLTGLPWLMPGLGSSIGCADTGPLGHADPVSSCGGSGSHSWVK
jgi:hypothetical protein